MVDPPNNDFRHAFTQDWQHPQHPLPSQRAQPQALAEASLRKGKKRSVLAVGAVDGQHDGAGGQTMVFPVKLHRMLTQIEEKANTDKNSTDNGSGNISDMENACNVISWQSHGRCFLVHDKETFVQRFLPSYFRQSKWASFQRQLNIYGFQRLTAGRDRGAYYHDLFLRGHPQLATRIHRMKLKGIGQGRHRTNAELEPNFYRMQAVGPGDQVDVTLIGMQPNASAAAVAYASGRSPALAPIPAPAVAEAQAHPNTTNVLQLFGGRNAGPVTKTSALPRVTHNADFNNVFFLTNANELASLQSVEGLTIAAGGAAVVMQDSSDAGINTQQEGLQPSKHHLSILANLFNAVNTTAQMASSSSGDAQVNHRRRTSAEAQVGTKSANDLNQWSQSNLLEGCSSNLALLQNPDTNLLTTATLKHYTDDSNTSDGTKVHSHGQASSDATSRNFANAASRPAPQSPWASLASAGLSSEDISSPNSAGASHGSMLVAKTSNNDLLDTFRLGGPSLRRMSAAAMSSLFIPHASNPTGASNRSGSSIDSNPNLLLFSSHQQSRNSSNSLIEGSSIDPSGALTTAQALNWMTAGHDSISRESIITATNTAPGPILASASHQLGIFDVGTAAGGNANVTQGTSDKQSGHLFGDILPVCGGTAANQPTFLDSVYEPIPIKEGANAAMETVVAASANGQQHKLSSRTSGVSSDPALGGVGKTGNHS